MRMIVRINRERRRFLVVEHAKTFPVRAVACARAPRRAEVVQKRIPSDDFVARHRGFSIDDVSGRVYRKTVVEQRWQHKHAGILEVDGIVFMLLFGTARLSKAETAVLFHRIIIR